METTGRIYIDQLSQRLRPPRAVHTIRQWVNDELLPENLRPGREGGRQVLFWTEDQMPGLQAFVRERENRRGWAGLHKNSEAE